ncbi:MAG: phospho-N-acetylmuramoyl-pentapeptide-transferase, partial [Eubacterium sp.]|nr:phospho-N-acetylmuramoyl-pentapeptide-transferase [Eubacterium sp.]
INVINCTDGVDGLCTTISVISLFTFLVITNDSSIAVYEILFIAALIAYLWFNASPSILLMGDAGSRTIGFFIALIAMKTGHPFIFVPLSLVFLCDGGLGLLKLALMRTICKGHEVFGNIRFPLHDELRKNRGWAVPKVAAFFIACEVVICVITYFVM